MQKVTVYNKGHYLKKNIKWKHLKQLYKERRVQKIYVAEIELWLIKTASL